MSVGCEGLGEPTADSVWMIQSSGLTREARVVIPRSYDPTVPTPVVLNFHGFTSNADQEVLLADMNALAEAEGFIVAYPQGTGIPPSWNAGACCGTAAADGVDDVQLTRDLLDELERQLCVDGERIFSTGMSNGGFLSHRLGCELSDRIAGIAPVAGVLGVDECAPGRPVPVIHFHGTSDLLVPYDGNDSLGFPSVAETIETWGAINGCSEDSEVVYERGDSRCERLLGCPADAPVTLCTVEGGGHTWPGGLPIPVLGKTTDDLDASAMLWDTLSAL